MNTCEERSANDHHTQHDSVYYAIIDRTGRILSMNGAMNKEYGSGQGNRQLDFFQSLLGENDRLLFSTLITKEEDTIPTSLPVNFYSYSGANRETAIKWMVFKLIALTGHSVHFLCAGYHNHYATNTEDISAALQQEAAEREEQAVCNEILLKMLENERLMIGQELHDNVTQLLCTAKLHLDVLEVFRDDNVQAKKATVELILEAIEEMKKLSRGLMLQRLKKETLLESIKTFVDDLRSINQMNIIFGVHQFNEALLTENQKIHIYRILQEQFRNITQHSKAKNVVMTLETDDKNIELIIDDDGIGFNPQAQVNGVGLLSIRERVKLLEGQCEITTSPGKGCQLHIIIPI
jgi:signal transduction histidine kinase